MDAEEYLKLRICSICHVAILREHPDEKLARLDWFKCPICGFTKQINVRKHNNK